MAYSLTLPDGTVVDGINDKYSREEALARIREKMPEAFSTDTRPASERFYSGMPAAAAPVAPKKSGVMGSLASGTESLLSSSLTGLQAVGGDAAEAAKAGIARGEQIGQKYTQEIGLQKIKDKYEGEGIGAAAAEVMRQFPHVLASQAPQIALTIAGAKGGALIGGGVAGPVGAAVGAVVGGAGSLLPQYIGTNVERQAQAQREAGQPVAPDVGKAALTGAGQAALDYASLRMLGGNMVAKWIGLPGKTAEQEFVKAAERSIKASAGVGAAKGLVEVPTEVAQQVLERWQAGLPVMDDKALAEYGEAAYMAGLLGPTIGGVGGIADRSSAKSQIEQEQRNKAIAEADAAAKAEAARLQSPEYLNSVEGLTAQRKKLGEQSKELRKQIKSAEGEEKDSLSAQHKELVGQIKALSERIETAKKTPEQLQAEYLVGGMQPSAAVQSAPAEIYPGVPLNEALAAEKADAKRRGEDWVDPNAPELDPSEPNQALIMSLTNPTAYKLWEQQAQREKTQEAIDSYDPINPPKVNTPRQAWQQQWMEQNAPRADAPERVSVFGRETLPPVDEENADPLRQLYGPQTAAPEYQETANAATVEPATPEDIEQFSLGRRRAAVEREQLELTPEQVMDPKRSLRLPLELPKAAATEPTAADGFTWTPEPAEIPAAPPKDLTPFHQLLTTEKDVEALEKAFAVEPETPNKWPQPLDPFAPTARKKVLVADLKSKQKRLLDLIEEQFDIVKKKDADAQQINPATQRRILKSVFGSDRVQATKALLRLERLRRLFVRTAVQEAIEQRSLAQALPLSPEDTARLFSEVDALSKELVVRAIAKDVATPAARTRVVFDKGIVRNTKQAAEVQNAILKIRQDLASIYGELSDLPTLAKTPGAHKLNLMQQRYANLQDTAATLILRERNLSNKLRKFFAGEGKRTVVTDKGSEPVPLLARPFGNYRAARDVLLGQVADAQQQFVDKRTPKTTVRKPFELGEQRLTNAPVGRAFDAFEGVVTDEEGRPTGETKPLPITRTRTPAPVVEEVDFADAAREAEITGRQPPLFGGDQVERLGTGMHIVRMFQGKVRKAREKYAEAFSALQKLNNDLAGARLPEHEVEERLRNVKNKLREIEKNLLLHKNTAQKAQALAEELNEVQAALNAVQEQLQKKFGKYDERIAKLEQTITALRLNGEPQKAKRLQNWIDLVNEERARTPQAQVLPRLTALVNKLERKLDPLRNVLEKVETLQEQREFLQDYQDKLEKASVDTEKRAANSAELAKLQKQLAALREQARLTDAPTAKARDALVSGERTVDNASSLYGVPKAGRLSALASVRREGNRTVRTAEIGQPLAPPLNWAQPSANSAAEASEKADSELDRLPGEKLSNELAKEMGALEKETLPPNLKRKPAANALTKFIANVAQGGLNDPVRAQGITTDEQFGAPKSKPKPAASPAVTLKRGDIAKREKAAEKRLQALFGVGKEGAALRTGDERGITPEEVTAGAQTALKLLPGLQWIPTFDQLPRSLAKKITDAGMDLADAKGGILPDGTIFIIGDRHGSAADLDATIAHEIIGHYRMDRVLFGNRTGLQLMTELAAKHLDTDAKINDLMYALGFDPVRVTNVMNSVEQSGASNQPLQYLREIVAYTAEMKPSGFSNPLAKNFWKAIAGALRNFFRNIGVDLKLNDNDVFYMVKQAQQGKLRTVEGGAGALRTQGNPELEAIASIIHPDKPGRWEATKSNVLGLAARTQWVDRFAPVAAVAERMTDSLRGLQMLYYARMADRVNQFVAEAMTNGPVSIQKKTRADGRVEHIYESTKGPNVGDLIKTLKGESFKQWSAYMALERAEQLPDGYSRLFGDRADKLSPAQRKQLLDYGRNNPAYQQARQQYRAYNAALVDFAVQTGFLSKRAGDEMKSRDYIPYYRVDEMGEIKMMGEHPIKIGNIRDQKELAQLFGSNKDIDDPYANIARNTRLLIGGAIRNQAAKNTAMELQKLGLGQMRGGRTEGGQAFGRNVIHFKGGKNGGDDMSFWMDTSADPRFADIPADLFVKGMEGIVTSLPNALSMLAMPTRILRDFITRNPLYVARQLVRDPMHAWMSTGVDFTSVAKAIPNVINLMNGKDATGNMLRERGLVGGQVIQGTDEDMAKIMAQLHAGQNVIDKLAAKADDMSVAADATTRAALYDDFKNKRGMSELEALMGTLDSINFATRGASPSIQMANMLVPFFNAQIQGLDSVYRAITGQMPFNDKMKARQKLAQRAAMVAASTLMYYALVQDEEWYKNTPENVRLANWLFKIPGVDEPVRIPIPFEFGLLFKALPEAVLIGSEGDPQSDAVWAAMRSQLVNTIPGGSSAMIPAGAKPLIEAGTNHSFFTGREIVPGYLNDADPRNQYTPNTTELAKSIAPALGISPMKLEHVIRGYTAGLGFAAMQMVDAVLGGTASPAPEKKLSQTMLVGPLFQPVDSTAIINRAFEAVQKIEAAKGRLNAAQTEMDPEKMQRVMAEEGEKIAAAQAAGRFRQQLGELSKLQRQVRFHPTMDPQEKRAMIDQLQQRKIELASQFETLVQ